jgi:hypothetical protein
MKCVKELAAMAHDMFFLLRNSEFLVRYSIFPCSIFNIQIFNIQTQS